MADANGIVQSNPMNSTHGKHTHNYSSFPDSLSYKNYMTLRFGEYTPSFFMEGVPKDEISLLANHLVDSLSLNAPFKGSIRKITESFSVPNMAILPQNWDKIYAQPANGDDVPKDVNCVLRGFPYAFRNYFLSMYSMVYSKVPDSTDTSLVFETICKWLTGLMRMLVVGEYIYSYGSLLNVSGYKAAAQFGWFYDNDERSYDYWFDLVINAVFGLIDRISVDVPHAGTYVSREFYGLSSTVRGLNGKKVESFRSMLELFRENPLASITSILVSGFGTPQDPQQFAAALEALKGVELPNQSVTAQKFFFRLPTDPASTDFDNDDLTDMTQFNLNLSRLLAYQLVCAHYYSNSAVDFIYSAEHYRSYFCQLERWIEVGDSDQNGHTFAYNGLRVPYDYLSGKYLMILLYGTTQPLSVPNDIWFKNRSGTMTLNNSWAVFTGKYYDYYNVYYGSGRALNETSLNSLTAFSMIFGFRKSLRFGDYFVGSRPRPLAPINTNVAVNSSQVSVIDITKSIQAQRFANAVMRSRAKIENYVADLFGKMPAPDFHNPFFLTRQAEVIYGDEVQNTADSQVTDPNSRTANFKSGDNRFQFTFHNDDAHPCVYLQMISFDVKRAYSRTIDRQFFHRDRYDMFNPDFQYIGDQPVYGLELGYPQSDDRTIPAVFAYQGRDMEYKQRFDVCSGGFVEHLPGWILSDRDRNRASYGILDPDFIRSYNAELDQFFLSLTGFSLASYFHFIVCVNNQVSAKRPMAVDPQILE